MCTLGMAVDWSQTLITTIKQPKIAMSWIRFGFVMKKMTGIDGMMELWSISKNWFVCFYLWLNLNKIKQKHVSNIACWDQIHHAGCVVVCWN